MARVGGGGGAGGVRARRVGQRRVLRARVFAAERGGVEPGGGREKEGATEGGGSVGDRRIGDEASEASEGSEASEADSDGGGPSPRIKRGSKESSSRKNPPVAAASPLAAAWRYVARGGRLFRGGKTNPDAEDSDDSADSGSDADSDADASGGDDARAAFSAGTLSVRSRHRRDRVVAWLCEFRSLTKVERRCVLRVTLCRCADPAQAADAAEELLALASVFLANPATWTKIGGDALARARWARARGASAPRRRTSKAADSRGGSWSCYTRA